MGTLSRGAEERWTQIGGSLMLYTTEEAQSIWGGKDEYTI